MMGAEKFGLGMEADEEDVELTTPTGRSPVPPRMMKSLDFEHIGSLAAVAESLSPGGRCRRALTSARVVIFQAKINVLLPFGPLAVLLHYLTGKHVSFLPFRISSGSFITQSAAVVSFRVRVSCMTFFFSAAPSILQSCQLSVFLLSVYGLAFDSSII
jgi:hypothetical protein